MLFKYIPHILLPGMSSHLPTPQGLTFVAPLVRWQDTLAEPVIKDFNPVIIVYRRPMFLTDHIMKIAGAGEFTHCEIYIPAKKTTFAIFAGGNMQCSTSLPNFYLTRPNEYAWHMLILNDAENMLLEKWHIDMIQKQCYYNFKDLLWKITPKFVQRSCVSDLTVETAHSPTNVFCSQAVILALREAFSCVSTKPSLKSFTQSMNSRITTPTQLEHCFVSHQRKQVNTGTVPLTFWDAREEYLTNTPYGFLRDEFPNLIDLKVDVRTW
jgi:hypothetical protein